MPMSDYKLSVEELMYKDNLDQFEFNTTADLTGEFDLSGQDRALRALDFGLNIKHKGYNIYALNFKEDEELTYILKKVKKVAKQEKKAADLCYVYNFSDPSQPLALKFGPGLGSEFKVELETKVQEIKLAINNLLSSEQYYNQKRMIKNEYQEETQQVFKQTKAEVKEMGYLLIKEEDGFSITPLLEDDQPMSEEEYNKLPIEKQQQIDEKVAEIKNKIDENFDYLERLEEEFKDKINKLENNLIEKIINDKLKELYQKFSEMSKVINYLDDLKDDILANFDKFKEEEEKGIFLVNEDKKDEFYKYEVNLVVDNSNLEGAPVIKEDNPTYYNLSGRVEYQHAQGGLETNFKQIKEGTLQQANGGYLILEADKLINNFKAWQLLKQVLQSGKIKMENLGAEYEQIPLATLEPEEIDLDLKVILVGSVRLYYLLQYYDSNFKELFKIKADFSTKVDKTNLNTYKLIQFISYKCDQDGLLDLDSNAVKEVLRYCSRYAKSQDKLAAKYSLITNLLKEADLLARQSERKLITAQDIRQIQQDRKYWNSKYESELQELYAKDKILLSTTGAKVGVINGLSIIDLGDYSFGRPTKITAVVYKGEEGIVNIEREINISGKIHDKGIMTLESYLGENFAQEVSLNLSARISFEQVYTEIDGDSASSAELYALLSALAKTPLRQDIAVTGSINQKGVIQPVGGVTDKVEGFFELCKTRGLTGSQGVIIPQQNKKDLVLSTELIKEVEKGRFSIYAISNVSEGLEILTELSSKEINSLITERINNWAINKKD